MHMELGFGASMIVIVGVFIFVLLLCVGVAKEAARTKWVCPQCYTVFRVDWRQAFPGVHYGDDVWLRCPKCKKDIIVR